MRYYRHTYLPHQCWSSAVNGGPTLFQHCVNVLCLLESGHSACSRQRADQASPVLNIARAQYVYTSLLRLNQRWLYGKRRALGETLCTDNSDLRD